jgi:hypothetical protein
MEVTKRKNRIGGQFAARLIEMLESPAYRVLSLSGHLVLARIEIEMAHHGGGDNGKLPVTYIDFEAYGIHCNAIGPAIRECEALGFIEVAERGFAGNREFRRPNLYRLTYRHLNRADPTHEWRRIKTIAEAQMIARQVRKSVRPQKQKTTLGIRPFSPSVSEGENGKAPPSVSEGTAHPRKPRVLSISTGRPGPSPNTRGRDGPGADHDGRHTRKSLMAYVANVIDEQLHDLDKRRRAARRRAKAAIMVGRE